MKTKSQDWRHGAVAALFALTAGLLSAGALAQDDAVVDDEDVAELGDIKVTGSRISRTSVEGAQPVTVITSEDIAVRGYVTVFEALSDLTQNSGYKFEGPEAQLFTPDVKTLNLRSFGVGYTLVLVNGRRVTNYPAAYQADTSVFNYGAIPAAAVERIEVLATGASAIYGSDAVAGVVNIILREDLNDTTANLLYSTPTEASGGISTERVQLVTGKLFERGSITASLEFQQRDPILGKDLDDYDSDLNYPYGQGYREWGIFNLNYWDFYAGGDAFTDPGEEACAALNNGMLRSDDPNGFFCGYDAAGETNFRNESEHFSAFVNGNYRLNDSVTLFADLLYFQSESVSNNWYIGIFEDFWDLDNIVPTPFSSIPFFYNWEYNFRAFTEGDLGRSLDSKFEDDALTATVGASGYWGQTNEWEFSFTHSEYELRQQQPWWTAQGVIDVFLGDYLGIGLLGDQTWAGNGSFGMVAANGLLDPVDADLVNSALGIQSYGNQTESQLASFTMNGDLMEMTYGPLSYAIVLEYETEDFKFLPDELIQQDPVEPFTTGSGWYNLTGYSGTGDRNRFAVGGELRVPVTDTLTLNLAARVDDYDSKSSSIGRRTTPSASFEWRPHERFLLRGGYTESFRAPDLNYVYTETGFFTGARDLVQCSQEYEFEEGTIEGFDPSACLSQSIFVKRIPAIREDDLLEPLKDETGWSKWIGFSVEPTENLSLQVDLSQIRLEDRVELESLQGLLNDEYACLIGDLTDESRCDYVSSRIERDIDDFTGFSYVTDFNASPINAALEEVTSLDAVLTYNRSTNFGDFRVRTEYTHTLDHTKKDDPDSEKQDLLNDPVLGGWDFRSIVASTFGYSRDDFSTALTMVRRGSTTLWRPSTSSFGRQQIANGDSRVGPYITWNLTASYDFTDRITARLRVQNLFDADPPSDGSFLYYDYPWYNYFVYPGAGIGRQAAVELNMNFD